MKGNLKPRSATHIDEHVGGRLKVLRKARHLSQTVVGEGVGVAFQQIQKYERGKNRISVSRLWQFCEFFDVNPDFFYRGIYREDNSSRTVVTNQAQSVSMERS